MVANNRIADTLDVVNMRPHLGQGFDMLQGDADQFELIRLLKYSQGH